MGGTFIACVQIVQSPPPPPPSPQYEGLYRTTDCRCLVPSPYYSARLMRFRSRGPSEFFFSDTPPKCLDRACVGRRRTAKTSVSPRSSPLGTFSSSARTIPSGEERGETMVFSDQPYRDQAWQCLPQRQRKTGNCYLSAKRVLQTVTSLRVVSLVFRGHDLLKISNINPQLARSQIFAMEKISSRQSSGNGAQIQVNT